MTELASIKDQVAAVTGGAAGIGLACAERFAAEGAKVAIIDRDRETGEAAVQAIEANGGSMRNRRARNRKASFDSTSAP